MEYIYIKREGDLETLKDQVKAFETYSNEELVAAYNKEAICGITGVHAQALYLISLGHVFLKRFHKSPINLENNELRLGSQIEQSGDTFEYI